MNAYTTILQHLMDGAMIRERRSPTGRIVKAVYSKNMEVFYVLTGVQWKRFQVVVKEKNGRYFLVPSWVLRLHGKNFIKKEYKRLRTLKKKVQQ